MCVFAYCYSTAVPDRRGWHPLPAPRALAELPLQAALARTPQLAGVWVLALIRSRGLEEIELVPLGELATGAPALCEQLIRAVHSDAALERLGAEQVWALSGARNAAEAVQALGLLREILSEELLRELAAPSPRQAADLCERVAHVCAVVLEAALGERTHAPALSPQAPLQDEGAGRAQDVTAGTGTGAGALREAGRALIVDELESAVSSPASAEPGGEAPAPAAGDEADSIAIRDERGERAAVAWLAAIARQLERYEADRLPFAVLLVELREIERLRLETSPAELAALGAELERVLAAELYGTGGSGEPMSRGRPPWTGALTPQRPGRCWLHAPGTDRRGARALADRLVRAVLAGVSHRGRPLEAIVGIAVCPQDGRQAAALAAHADIDLHAARAARPG